MYTQQDIAADLYGPVGSRTGYPQHQSSLRYGSTYVASRQKLVRRELVDTSILAYRIVRRCSAAALHDKGRHVRISILQVSPFVLSVVVIVAAGPRSEESF